MTVAKDIRTMSERELVEHLANTRKELFGLRLQHATGELENTAGLRAAKRELARSLTIATERRHTLANTKSAEN